MAEVQFVYETIRLFTKRTLSDARPLQRTPTLSHEAADTWGALSGTWNVPPTYRSHAELCPTPVAGVGLMTVPLKGLSRHGCQQQSTASWSLCRRAEVSAAQNIVSWLATTGLSKGAHYLSSRPTLLPSPACVSERAPQRRGK